MHQEFTSATAEIPLRNRQGEVIATAVVDAEDAHLATPPWHLHKTGYVVRSVYLGGGRANARFSFQRLHREVADAPAGVEVDHIDGDPLNNRRANLRIASQAQNAQNRPRNSNNHTGRFRGVSWHPPTRKWRARVHVDGTTHHLGVFETQEDADAAASAFRSARMEYTNETRRGLGRARVAEDVPSPLNP